MDLVVVEVTRQALLASFPDEVEDLDAALNRLEHAGRSRTRPPVGMGIDMMQMSDYLLTAVAGLLGAVGGALAEQAADVLSEKTRKMLASRRGGSPDSFDPLDPEQEEEVCAAVVLTLTGKVTPDEAQTLGRAVIGALRLRHGGHRG